MRTLNTKEKLVRDKMALSGNKTTSSFSVLIYTIPFHLTNDSGITPTGCTDGYNVWINEGYYESLIEGQRRFLIVHELMHIIPNHLVVWQSLRKKHPMYANMAMDHWNNLTIKYEIDPTQTFLVPIKGALCDDKYRVNGVILDTKSIFDDLYKQVDKEKENGNGQTSGDNSKQKVQQEGDSNEGQTLDGHMWDKAQEMAKDETKSKKMREQIRTSLRQGKMYSKRTGGNALTSIDKILESKIDWKELLRSFLTNTNSDREVSSWRRPNRRWIHQDVYLPSIVSESAGDLVLAIDRSGSIGTQETQAMLGTLAKICKDTKPSKVYIAYWDTAVNDPVEVYEQHELENIISSTKPRGGGGTDPRCIPAFLKEKKINPEAVVVLTDGAVGSWGKWDCPVFWGITQKGITANVGTSVHVDVN